MADKLGNKKVELKVDLNARAAEESAEKLGNTLKRIAAGIPLNEYFKDTAVLISDLQRAYQQFQNEASRGDVTQKTAENLMKLANAVSGMAIAEKKDIETLIPSFSEMRSAIDQATRQAGLLSHAFSASNFTDAFQSFARLKSVGVDLGEELKSLGSEHTFSALVEENKTLQHQLMMSRSELNDLQRDFDKLAATDISSLQRKLDALYEQAEYEVSSFFTANNVPQTWMSGYDDAIERIRDANKTSGEVITEWKRNFGELLGQSAHGTGSPLDPALFDELATKMQPIMDRISELETVIRNIGSGTVSGSAGELKAVVETLTESGQAAEGATKLLSVLEQITSGSTDNIEMLRRTLNALADLDKIKISKAAMTNLGDFLTKIKEVPDVSRLAALSSIDLSGFNNLSIKKASLENLATYLPAIANVNVDALAKISALPLDKLNNLTVKVDFGKQRFQEEADGVQSLNEKFKEHTGIIEQAIRAENDKYDVSQRLTEQLREEKKALDALPDSSSSSTGSSQSSHTSRQSSEEAKRARQEAQMWAAYEKERTQEAKAYSEYRAQAAKAEAEAEKQARREVADFEKAEAEAAKQTAAEEAQMWAAYEQQKTEEAKAWSEQRGKDAASAANERARLEQEASDAVAAANRDDWDRQEELFDRAAKRHTASLKEKARAEQAASKEAEQAAKNQQKAAEQQIKTEQRLEAQHARAGVTYDKLTNKVTTYFHKFEDEIKKNPTLMAQYEQLLNNLNTKSFGDNMTNATAAVQKFQITCEQAGVGVNSFLKRLVSGFANKLFYGGLAKAAAELRRLVVQIYNNVKDIDAAMTQLQIVTGASDTQMEKFLTQSTQLARELGQSISDVMKSIETFSRLGYNLTDASELARYATVLSNVAAVDVGTATTGLTSIIKAFGMQVSDSEHVADVLVNVGQKYAISAEELMAAFERGGSALAATGTSFDKASALFAAANASMQNAEKIGTAIQTVSARIRGAKSELEELGIDYEDVAEGVSKYRDELMALTNVTGTGGFDIMADVNTGKYKDIYDIFVGIAGIWNQLSDTSQARVAEILGGTRQLSVISSVIKNISDAQGALEVAQNSTGVALKANDTYLESIQGRVGVLTADFQDMSQSILNSGLIEFGVSALDTLVKFVDKAAEAKVLLPGILTILTSINAVGTFRTEQTLLSGLLNDIRSVSNITQEMQHNFAGLSQARQGALLGEMAAQAGANRETQKAIANELQLIQAKNLSTVADQHKAAAELSELLQKRGINRETRLQIMQLVGLDNATVGATGATVGHTAALQGYAGAVAGATGANAGFIASLKSMMATPSGLFAILSMIASLLATVLIPAISAAIKTTKELREEYEKEKDEVNTINSEYETNAQRLEELIKLQKENDFSDERQAEIDDLIEKNTKLKEEYEYKKAIADLDRAAVAPKIQSDFVNRLYTTENVSPEDNANYYTMFNSEQMLREGWLKVAELNAQIETLQQSAWRDPKKYDEQIKLVTKWRDDVIRDVDAVVKAFQKDKDYFDEDTLSIFEPLVSSWQTLVRTTTNGNDSPFEAITDDVTAATDTISQSVKSITSILRQLGVEITAIYGKGGKVDLVNRPSVTVTANNLATVQGWGMDAQIGDTMTVASQTYRDAKKAIVVTPILPDGTLLTQDALDKYIDEIIWKTAQAGDGDYAKHDDKGIIMAVFGDKDTWEENLALSEEFAVKVHEIHEAMLNAATPQEAEAYREALKALIPSNDELKQLDALRDGLSLLHTAFQEANEANSLGVTYKTLSSIAEKFADVDGIDKYINRLAAAGRNADQVQQILSELAGEILTNATNSKALANASNDVVAAMLREAGVSKNSINAFINLRSAMVSAANTTLNFSQQCAAILDIATAAGIATASLRNMFNAAAGEYSEHTEQDYSGELDEYGGYVYGDAAHKGQYKNTNQAAQSAWIAKQAAAAGLSVEQFTIKTAYEKIQKEMLKSFELSGADTITGGGGGSTPEEYIPEIDKYREAIRKLNQAQEEREKIEHDLSRTEDPREKINLERQLIQAFQDEQDAQKTLNGLRSKTIEDSLTQLQNLGFVVQYNAEANDFWIENLDHLQEIGSGTQEQINEARKDAEDLINGLTELNDSNRDGADSINELTDSISDAHKEINSLLEEIVNNASNAIDDITGVYDTLHNAADEYAKTGNISVDTLQSLLTLGPQYMQYLTNENGELEVNEERIRAVIDAKTEQLAVEGALAYVEALSIAKLANQGDDLDRLLNATEDYTDVTWGLVDAKLAEIGLNDEETAKAQHVIDMYKNMSAVTRLNVTEIEKYRDALHNLEIAQRQQADLEHALSGETSDNHQDVRNAQRQVAIQRSLIDTYAYEQEIISNLRAQRSADIEDNITKLRELGFVVQYNAETDDFYIENLEHLNNIQGESFDSTQDLITRTEELVNSNKESADSYSELADSIAEAERNIDELLTTIVERASQALDNMQSLYDTLHQAADEYADTGFVSMDTVQSLIGLGTQYMQYLIDENGQLVINEDRIKDVLKAKMEELALDNAMAYVESIRLAKARGNNEEMQRLIFATEAAKDATWGLVYASIQLLDVSDEEREAIYHNVDAMRYLAEQSMENIGGEISNMKQSVSDLLRYVMDMLKQQVQDEIDALGEQKDAYSKIIQSQKEYLKNTKEANNYQKSVANKLKDIAKLQERIDALSLDNSREAQAQRVKLLEELREKQEDLEETQNDESISRQEDTLDKMEEAYHDEKDAEIKALEDSVSSTEKLYRKAMDYLENTIGTDYKRLRDELCQWNYDVGNSFQSEIEAACDGALAALQRFGGSWNSIMTTLNANGAADSINNLAVGNTTPEYSHATTPEEQQQAQQQTQKQEEEYEPQVYLVNRDGHAPPGLNQGDYVLTYHGLYRVDAVNPDGSYQGSPNPVDTTYAGTPYDDLDDEALPYYQRKLREGVRYHTGGIIGDATLKQDEMMAILQKGEAVLTSRQQKTINDVLDFMSSLRDRLSGALSRARIPSMFDNMRIGDFMNRAGSVGGEVNVQFGDVIINGADPDAVAKHRAVNREFVNEVVKVLNLRK